MYGRVKNLLSSQKRPEAHPIFQTIGIGIIFSGVKKADGGNLTNHVHLVPRFDVEGKQSHNLLATYAFMGYAGTPVSLSLHIFKGFISPCFLLTEHECVLIFLSLILAYTLPSNKQTDKQTNKQTNKCHELECNHEGLIFS
jgi:hypothetical protein